jgi:hypothetical protein
MNLYVAGASKEPERVQRMLDALRQAEHTISFDWLEHIRASGGNALPSGDFRRESSRLDLQGIEESDLFLLLHPAKGVVTTGAWFELGYAFGRRISGVRPFAFMVAYETEIFEGPCLFDSFVFGAPRLDSEIIDAIAQLEV